MKNGRKSGAPESFIAGSVGFIQRKSIPKIIFGMLCRFIVAFAGASGVCLMFDNAFGFAGAYEPLKTMFVCLLFCAAWMILCVASDINIAVFAAAATAYITAFIFTVVRLGPVEAFAYVPVSMWNKLLLKLDSLGFTALSGFKAAVTECDPSTAQGEYFAKIGFYAFCAIISLIFISCLYKRVRAVPVIISSGIVMTVTFTYNLLSDNLGFLLTAASAAGMLVLLNYSAFTKQKANQKQIENESIKSFRSKRKGLVAASVPGLAALIAAALVFAVGVYPAVRIDGPAPRLTVLDGIIDGARDIFTRRLIGEEDPDAVEYDAYKKSTEPTPRNFKEKKMLTVTAGYPTAVYLRAWASDYYSTDKWTSLSEAPNGVSIVPEEITELFYKITDVNANIPARDYMTDTDCMERGFVKEFVTVKNEGLSGDTGLLASRFSTIYGIMKTDMSQKYGKEYRLLEGVGTVMMSMKNAEYGSVAYSPIYTRVDLQQLDRDAWIYENVVPYIKEYAEIRRMRTQSEEAEDPDEWLVTSKSAFYAAAEEHGYAVPEGCIINRLSYTSDAELSNIINKLSEIQKYEEYVYENCTSTPWSDGELLKKASNEAFGGRAGDKPSEIFGSAVDTARYLAEKCRYDLSPQGYTDRGSYVAQFLTAAKNGYCVQYATAGALILRAAGIPTRYVDGYLASDFYSKDGKFICSVLDSDAHAWVEVYIRGYGWMTFEMTEPMLDGIYGAPDQDGDESDTRKILPDVTHRLPDPDIEQETKEHVTHPPITETEPEGQGVPGLHGGKSTSKKTFAAFGITLLCVTAVSTVVYIYLRTVTKKAKRRLFILTRAAKGESPDPEKEIKDFSDYIFFLFAQTEVKRSSSELMDDFAKRVDRTMGSKMSFIPAARAMQKNSFGHCADKNDCKHVAEFALFLEKYTSKRLPRLKKFWYCKVRKII